MFRKKTQDQGFTLIELCIVLIVLSMMLVGMMSVYKNYVAEKRQAQFTATMNAVTSALAYYVRDEGPYPVGDPRRNNYGTGAGIDNTVDPTRFPCPAAPEIGIGQDGFGVERRNLTTGSCQDGQGVVRVNGPDGPIFIGSVPTTTLEISGNQMLDGYGRRLTYAVSDSVSHSRPTPTARGGALGGQNNPTGSITMQIVDDAGATRSVSGVPFALIGHGQEGMGAYSVSGVRTSDCVGTSKDAENCNNNHTFVESNAYRGSLSTSDQFYDDTVVYSLRGIADKEDYWGLGIDTQDIMNMNTGRVGIGTPSPAQKLQVNGNILARSYLHVSDSRLKENVADFDPEALKKIMMLRIVTFNQIGDENKETKFGVIAQEIQKIYPELVHTDDKGFLNVDYVGLTAPIIKGLQEMNVAKDKEITDLKEKVTSLEERLQAIEQKLTAEQDGKKVPE